MSITHFERSYSKHMTKSDPKTDTHIEQTILHLQKKISIASEGLNVDTRKKTASKVHGDGSAAAGMAGMAGMAAGAGAEPNKIACMFKGIMAGMTCAIASYIIASFALPHMTEPSISPEFETAETEMKGAKLSMKSAQYSLINTEIGPALDITITVSNKGETAGRPEQFNIELIDDHNQQVMLWPMHTNMATIPPKSEQIYRTHLIEPPPEFRNMRVTMKK